MIENELYVIFLKPNDADQNHFKIQTSKILSKILKINNTSNAK